MCKRIIRLLWLCLTLEDDTCVIRCFFSQMNIWVTFRPCSTFRKLLVYPKDPLPVEKRTNVVYVWPLLKFMFDKLHDCWRQDYMNIKPRWRKERRSRWACVVKAAQGRLEELFCFKKEQHLLTMPPWIMVHSEKYHYELESGTLHAIYTSLLN